MDLNINGKTGIVAGGSAGMGKATALQLAQEGVDLIITARGKERLEAPASEIRDQTNASVTTLAADHATQDGRKALYQLCPDPDIMVVTISPPELVWDYNQIQEDDWRRSVDAGLIGPVELIKLFTPGMVERGWGRFVNIATVAAKEPLDMRLMSGPARSALANYTAVVSRQLAKNNVILNNVLPGMYATEGMIKIAEPHMDRIAEQYGKEVADNLTPEMVHKMVLDMFDIPTESLGDPNDLAQFVSLLCAESAKFTVGQNLVLDGGMARSIF